MVISYTMSGQCVSGDGHNDKRNLLGVISFQNLEHNSKNVRSENDNFDKFHNTQVKICQNCFQKLYHLTSLDPFDSFIDYRSYRLQQG